MAFKDVGVEVGLLAAANRSNEVGEVVASRSSSRSLHARQRLGTIPPTRIEVARADDGASFQLEGVAHHLIAITLGRQTANLEDQLRLAVIEEGNLGVGGLPLIGVAEAAAQADDAARHGGAGD